MKSDHNGPVAPACRRRLLASFLLCFGLIAGSPAPAIAAPGDPLAGFATNGTRLLFETPSAPDDQIVILRALVQPDGKVLVVAHNFVELVVIRLTDTGSFDASYGSGGIARIGAIRTVGDAVLQPDSKLILVGPAKPGPGNSVVRLTEQGALDASFGTAGAFTSTTNLSNETIALAPDGKILVGGQTVLSRLLPNGGFDPAFGSGGGAMQLPSGIWPRALAVDTDGSIAAAGEFVFSGVPRRQRVTRVLPGGAVDMQFGTNGVAETALAAGFGNVDTLSLVIDSSRRLLLGAEAQLTCGSSTCQALVVQRVLATGAVDAAFGAGGTAQLGATNYLALGDMALQPDGAILVSGRGWMGSVTAVPFMEIVLARLTADGLPDAGFGPAGIRARDLDSSPPMPGILGATRSGLAIRPDGVAFVATGWEWEGGNTIGVGNGAVSSFLLRDANGDGVPEGWDLTPDAIALSAVNGAAPDAVIESALTDVTGLETGVSVPVFAESGEIAVNGAATYGSWNWVRNGDRVSLRRRSSATPGASVTARAIAGGLLASNNSRLALGTTASGTFTIRTRSGPAITGGLGTFATPENGAAGTLVTTLTASSPVAGALAYAITAGNTGNAFSIDATGQLKTAAALDFETRPNYSLTVKVTDASNAEITGTVTVNVTNVAEAPQITGGTATVTVPENAATGTLVSTITAQDPEGDAITYSLTAGNVGNAFSIDATGQLKTAAELDFETRTSYALTIEARDPGGLSSTANLTINIGDVADTPGTLAFSQAAPSVAESATTVTLSVSRSGGTTGAVTVAWASAAGTATSADFTAANGTLSWANGEGGDKTLTITLLPDTVDEPAESFTVSLSNATGGATIGASTATVTINDDDPAATGGGGSSGGSGGGGGGGGAFDGLSLLAVVLALGAGALARRRHPQRVRHEAELVRDVLDLHPHRLAGAMPCPRLDADHHGVVAGLRML